MGREALMPLLVGPLGQADRADQVGLVFLLRQECHERKAGARKGGVFQAKWVSWEWREVRWEWREVPVGLVRIDENPLMVLSKVEELIMAVARL